MRIGSWFKSLSDTVFPHERLFAGRLNRHPGLALADAGALLLAALLDLGLPHCFRGTSLARLPGCAGRAETVVADLEFVLAVKDQFPPGLMRAAYEGLSHAYRNLGRTEEAEAARSRSGRLITDYWVTADDGFRFVPPRLAELALDVHVAQGTERRPMWKPVTSAAAGLKRM